MRLPRYTSKLRAKVDAQSDVLKQAYEAEIDIRESENKLLKNSLASIEAYQGLAHELIAYRKTKLADALVAQLQKDTAALQRKQKRGDAKIRQAEQKREQAEAAYIRLRESLMKRWVFADVAILIFYTVLVLLFFWWQAKRMLVIQDNYFVATSQIFPIIFVALYFGKALQFSSLDQKWAKTEKLFDGVAYSAIGTAASLFALATGHLKFIAYYITVYCFSGLLFVIIKRLLTGKPI